MIRTEKAHEPEVVIIIMLRCLKMVRSCDREAGAVKHLCGDCREVMKYWYGLMQRNIKWREQLVDANSQGVSRNRCNEFFLEVGVSPNWVRLARGFSSKIMMPLLQPWEHRRLVSMVTGQNFMTRESSFVQHCQKKRI